VGDDLPLLLGGELGRSRLSEVVGHLRECPHCRAELVEASGAHAALTAARRLLDPSVAGPAVAAARASGESGGSGEPEELPPLSPLPPAPDRSDGRSRRSGRLGRRDVLVGAVAAVTAAAIALGGVALTGSWPGRSPRAVATASQQARLVPVVAPSGTAPVPSAAGVVSMTGTAQVVMTIRITGLPAATTGHFYYAWLLDPSTNKMLPVGVVDASGSSRFDLGADLVKRYTAVDISLQADDGDPQHSPVSVLRASYGT
jgi:hypothetical protein